MWSINAGLCRIYENRDRYSIFPGLLNGDCKIVWIGLDISTCLSISLCVEFIHVMNYRIIINSTNPLKSGLGTYHMTLSQL